MTAATHGSAHHHLSAGTKSPMKNLIVLLILGLAVWGGYRHFTRVDVPTDASALANAATAQPDPTRATKPAAPAYTCDGRTHCSQMRSCDEATYFIQHCPNTQMDGNRDGVPCERQWCG